MCYPTFQIKKMHTKERSKRRLKNTNRESLWAIDQHQLLIHVHYETPNSKFLSKVEHVTKL
jgi:hypothetical protein